MHVRVRVYVCNDDSIAFFATARLDSLHFPIMNPMPLPVILRDTRYFFAWDNADKRACQTQSKSQKINKLINKKASIQARWNMAIGRRNVTRSSASRKRSPLFAVQAVAISTQQKKKEKKKNEARSKRSDAAQMNRGRAWAVQGSAIVCEMS